MQETIATKTVRIENNGMTYDIELTAYDRTTDTRFYRAGKDDPIGCYGKAFKVKKNGQRGMEIGRGFTSQRIQVLTKELSAQFAAELMAK